MNCTFTIFFPCPFHRTLPKTSVSLRTQEKHLVFHTRDICTVNPTGCALLGIILDKPVISSSQNLHRWEADKPNQTKSWIIKVLASLHVRGIHFQRLQTLLSFMELPFWFTICSTSCRFPLKPCYSLTKKISLRATGDSEAAEAAESRGKNSVLLEIISTYSNTWHAQKELWAFCEV